MPLWDISLRESRLASYALVHHERSFSGVTLLHWTRSSVPSTGTHVSSSILREAYAARILQENSLEQQTTTESINTMPCTHDDEDPADTSLRAVTPPQVSSTFSRSPLENNFCPIDNKMRSGEGESSPTGAASYLDEYEEIAPSYFIPGITARARCLSDVGSKDDDKLTEERTASSSSFSTITSFSASMEAPAAATNFSDLNLSMRQSSRGAPEDTCSRDSASIGDPNILQGSTTLLESLQEGFEESLQLQDSTVWHHHANNNADTDDDSDQIFAWDDDNRSVKKELPPLELWKKENWDELSSSRGSVENRDQLQHVRKMLEARYHLGVRRGAEQAKQAPHQVRVINEETKKKKKKKKSGNRTSAHRARKLSTHLPS